MADAMTQDWQVAIEQHAGRILRQYVGPWAWANLPWKYLGHVDDMEDVGIRLGRVAECAACKTRADVSDVAAALHADRSRNLLVLIVTHGHVDPVSGATAEGAPAEWGFLSVWPKELTRPAPSAAPGPPT